MASGPLVGFKENRLLLVGGWVGSWVDWFSIFFFFFGGGGWFLCWWLVGGGGGAPPWLVSGQLLGRWVDGLVVRWVVVGWVGGLIGW